MRRVNWERYWEQTEPGWDRGDVPWLVRILVRWLIVALGFLAAREVVNEIYEPDRFFLEGWEAVAAASGIFVIVRALVRPVLIFLTCPLQLITLGLFMLVVNALILLLTEEVAGWFDVDFAIAGFWPAFIGALVISAVSFLASRLFRRNPFGPRLL